MQDLTRTREMIFFNQDLKRILLRQMSTRRCCCYQELCDVVKSLRMRHHRAVAAPAVSAARQTETVLCQESKARKPSDGSHQLALKTQKPRHFVQIHIQFSCSVEENLTNSNDKY